jgi:triacylglycerol lipase
MSNLSKVCVGDLCQECLWQQSNGSHYYAALQYSGFQALVSTTVIWTKTDGVVEPAQQNAALPGATVLSVQQLCPGRRTIHTQMTTDAAAYALALDALKHGGTASLSRVLPSVLTTCTRTEAKNMDETVAEDLLSDLDDLINGFLYVRAS